MKYKKLLEKALPYYEKGRPGDVEHVKWLYKVIPEHISDAKIDLDILMPLAILHDVGYSKIKNKSDPFDLKNRKLHMKEGAIIAEKILKELDWPKEKIKEIKKLVSIHDNWALGKSFNNDPYIHIFHNFDFMWCASKKGFDIVRKFTDKNEKEFYKQVIEWEKTDVNERDGWYDKSLANLFKKLLKERERGLLAKK